MLIESRIDPIRTARELKENYLSFLTASFSLRNVSLSEQFKDKLRHSDDLFKGPILQANPHYRTAHSLNELVQMSDSGVCSAFEAYGNLGGFSTTRPLYVHQEKALRKAAAGENIIVATGTGSGKTESFLLPIINHLLKEKQSGPLTPGVRALLIYPMNALANDQVKRLREILPPETGITFGRYTGQTPHDRKQAVKDFKIEQGQNTDPQENELISRDEIQSSPPHILLTNYAMLEYLLLRPEDAEIFENGHTWKFLVLDEAHTYKGAMGAEIGYLMRKVKERVAGAKADEVQCIATSATIGDASIEGSSSQVTQAVGHLFGATFKKENLIVADQIGFSERFEHELWGRGTHAFYQKLMDTVEQFSTGNAETIQHLLEGLEKHCLDPGYPNQESWSQALEQVEDKPGDLNVCLYELLKGDERLYDLARELEAQPQSLDLLIEKICADEEQSDEILLSLINLGTLAKNPVTGVPLVMARYHFFVKAMEGLSVAFPPDREPVLKIGRFSNHVEHGNEMAAFELKGCKRCGVTYVTGELHPKENMKQLVSFPPKTQLTFNENQTAVYALNLSRAIEASDDEDALSENEQGLDSKAFKAKNLSSALNEPEYLCTQCGVLHDESNPDLRAKCCPAPSTISVRKVEPSGKGNIIKTCPACGGQKKQSSIIHSFRTNENEAAFMLSRTLFQQVPATVESQASVKPKTTVESTNPFAKLSASKKVDPAQEKGKRRLLAFSDSRMQAAFFTSYMQQQSEKVLHRQLIYSAIQQLEIDHADLAGFSLKHLKDKAFDKYANEQEVGHWIYAELCAIQPRKSLEGVGLLHYRLNPEYVSKILEAIEQFEGVFEQVNLKTKDIIPLLEYWLAYLRKRSVVSPLEGHGDLRNPYFWPRNRPYTFTKDITNQAISVTSWMGAGNRHNGRTDYLERLWSSRGIAFDFKSANDALNYIFLFLNQVQEATDIIFWKDQSLDKLWESSKLGKAHQLDSQLWVLSSQPPPDSELYGWYRCDSCGNLSGINYENICPSYRCTGNLDRVDPLASGQADYYQRLYRSEKRFPIHIAEHTAQITTQAGSERQQQFVDDNQSLNMLSCSTTFELGVDVGQLHAVFMRNAPPAIANYVQRAGRAARRLDATAFILTFCRARSHDLSCFQHADEWVNGSVSPPQIPQDNLDIARRHLHSVVLASFLKTFPSYFSGPENTGRGHIRWLFFGPPGEDICRKLYDWLRSHPPELAASLQRIFNNLSDTLGIKTWNWVEALVSPDDKLEDNLDESARKIKERDKPYLAWKGILGQAQAEIYSEFLEYKHLEGTKDEYRAEQHITRIKSMYLLQYLPARGVFPKYGFPVDVVELKIRSKDQWAQDIEISRDLRLAISEFAPGCELVANGHVITSYALEKVMGKRWREYQYKICGHCGRFERSKSKESEVDHLCKCGHGSALSSGTFIIPEFGFTTAIDMKSEAPVDAPPKRTFASQVYFSSYDEPPEPVPFHFDEAQALQLKTIFSTQGKLVVINDNRNQKFHICRSCGYGSRSAVNKVAHQTPYGTKCINGSDGSGASLKKAALGHEFKTDVLELQLSGSALSDEQFRGQDIWLSVQAALVRGACQALEIEEENIDGTIGNYAGNDYRSIVLYDTFPGGAGFVRQINLHLQRVIQAALDIAENCPTCSVEQSCNQCLRRYQNQFAHELLKRGPAAEVLRLLYDSLFNAENDGFYPPEFNNSAEWFKSQLNSRRVALYLAFFEDYSDQFKDWFQYFLKLLQSGADLRLVLYDPNQHIFSKDNVTMFPYFKILLENGLELYTVKAPMKLDCQAVLDKGAHTILAKWSAESDSPFQSPTDKTLRVKVTSQSYHSFDMLDALESEHWSQARLDKVLESLLMIPLKKDELTNWSQLLKAHLPRSIDSVTIYDRYIRQSSAFQSVQNLLEMLNAHAKTANKNIDVEIQTSYGLNKNKENQDRRLKKNAEDTQIAQHLFFDALSKAQDFRHLNFKHLSTKHKWDTDSHQRYLLMKTPTQTYDFKLEKGLDILKQIRQSDVFRVEEDSYIILDKNRSDVDISSV